MIDTLYSSRRLYYTLFEHEYQGTADELCDALWDGEVDPFSWSARTWKLGNEKNGKKLVMKDVNRLYI